MASTSNCFCCKKSLNEGEIIEVRNGIHNLRRVSQLRQDGNLQMLKKVDRIEMHKFCRRDYIMKQNITRDLKNTATLKQIDHTLRSEEEFDFKTNCLFCSEKCDIVTGRKKPADRREVMWEVRTLSMKNKLLEEAVQRNDEWGQKVSRRVNSVICLVAEEARYHEKCYSKFTSNRPSNLKRGRPQNEDSISAFEKLCLYIDESEECQFSLHDLIKKLEENMPEGSSLTEKTLKSKLMNTYGDGMMIAQMKKRPTVVCFRGSGLKLINTWYSEREKNEKDERLRIVKTAATIVREDIRTTAYNTTDYPDITEFMKNAEDVIPETLHAFLDTVIKKNRHSSKKILERQCTAIAHSIISATRPRSFLSPILLGLSVYLFRKVGSKSIVNIVSNLGFCSSYNDVALFESSAVTSWKPAVKKDSFCQYVFDNADFNINTLTGRGTFHSMGGIKCITPSKNVIHHEIAKLRIIPASTEITEIGQMKIQTFLGKRKNGLNAVKLQTVYKDEACTNVRIPSPKDVLWMYGKFLHTSSFPSWQGFMETITHALPYDQTEILTLPFINLPATEYNTVLTALQYAAEETKKSSQSTCFVTFDQPLYMKAKDIVSSCEDPEEGVLSNIIVRLGGFHLLMSYLGSIGYIMGGSGISELWSMVFASSSVPQMLSGHAYARAIRAHLLTYCALAKIMFQEITVDDADKQHVQEILLNFESQHLTLNSVENDDVVQRIQLKFTEQITSLMQKGKTAQLWLQYFDLVTVLLHFIEAERMGNWSLHLDCIRGMLPIFYASGHILYAKSCQLYLQDMDSLHLNMPHDEFQKFTSEGYFTIRRSEKFWCGVWSDMTIEQTLMKNMKSVGGISHGRGFTESVLNKWIFGLPVSNHICENMEEFCGIRTSSSFQHIELRDTRIKKDEDDVQKFLVWLQQHCPFTNTALLVSLSSGLVAPENINCYIATDIGKKIMDESLRNKETFGEFKVQRSKRVKPISFTNTSVKVANDYIQVDTTQLFQRIICTVKLPEDLKTCFSHELASVPLAIFDERGLMRKTQKSSLYKIFNNVKERVIDKPNTTYHVIDGGNLIHRVVWPKRGTFADVIAMYVQFIRKHYTEDAMVIFDGYSTNDVSTKSIVRQQRILKLVSSEIIFDENTPLTVPQEKFLSNVKNKERLIMQLEQRFQNEGIDTHVATDDADLLIVQSAIKKRNQYEYVIVVGQDVDLLILLVALAPEDKDILFLKEAQGSLQRKIYSSQDIQCSSIIKNIRHSILFAHAFSGCDTTSSFYAHGKMKLVSLLNTNDHLQDIVSVFNNPQSTHDEVAVGGERLILALYKAPSSQTNLNHYRYVSFNKSVSHSNHAVFLSSLPPTSGAARQHSYRVYQQIQTWRGKTVQPELWGWKKK